MGIFDFLRFDRTPAGARHSTLVVMEGKQLTAAARLIGALQDKFGNVAVGCIGNPAQGPVAWPLMTLPSAADKAAAQIARLKPARLVLLGLDAEYTPLTHTGCPSYWVNAHEVDAAASAARLLIANPMLQPALPQAMLTGDPLLDLDALPALPRTEEICERFREQRAGGRWIGYFAGTGEDEEEVAYPLFNRLIRTRMGLMVLAPRDPARCEPVYREALKYHLQTIRHRRLSTSFVPIKTRVYFVEDPDALEALYPCADFVVAGGTLHPNASNAPDLVSPMLHGRPVIVGPAQRELPLIRAAVAADVVRAARNEEGLFEHAKTLIEAPDLGQRQAEAARRWLGVQAGALARVVEAIA